MFTFIKNKMHTSLTNHKLKFTGCWQIDKASIVSFGREMDLEPDEFEIIEDSLNCGLFVISGYRYSYTGNRLFPVKGTWRISSDSEITLSASGEDFKLALQNNTLVYFINIDDYIGYKVYFTQHQGVI